MDKKLSIKDFLLISMLGKGFYGKVILARKKENNKIYAMKIVKKKKLIDKPEYMINERNILA